MMYMELKVCKNLKEVEDLEDITWMISLLTSSAEEVDSVAVDLDITMMIMVEEDNNMKTFSQTQM